MARKRFVLVVTAVGGIAAVLLGALRMWVASKDGPLVPVDLTSSTHASGSSIYEVRLFSDPNSPQLAISFHKLLPSTIQLGTSLLVSSGIGEAGISPHDRLGVVVAANSSTGPYFLTFSDLRTATVAVRTDYPLGSPSNDVLGVFVSPDETLAMVTSKGGAPGFPSTNIARFYNLKNLAAGYVLAASPTQAEVPFVGLITAKVIGKKLMWSTATQSGAILIP